MATTYVRAQDVFFRLDKRTIMDLLSDTGSPVPEPVIDTHVNFVGILEAAEGQVLAALAIGGRYTSEDLGNLTGVSLAYLRRIIAEVAEVELLARRGDRTSEVADARQRVFEQHLKPLQDGKAIFTTNDSDITASRPAVDGPTLTEHYRLNGFTDRSGYFRSPVMPEGRNN